VGKAKAKFSTSSILKKINLTKRILKNKYVEKYCSKTKTMSGKYRSNLQCFFIKKTTKLNPQPAQYEKKLKGSFLEKKSYKKTLY